MHKLVLTHICYKLNSMIYNMARSTFKRRIRDGHLRKNDWKIHFSS